MQDAIRALILVSKGSPLSLEILASLKKLGHGGKIFLFPETHGPVQVLEQFDAEIELFKPNILISVNSIGIDLEGYVVSVLKKRGVPTAIWFVDSPFYLSLDRDLLKDETIFKVFLWDRDYHDEFKKNGYSNTYYLPLATDPSIFRLLRRHENPLIGYHCKLSFVGGTRYHKVAEKLRALGLSDGTEALLDQISQIYLKSGKLRVAESIPENLRNPLFRMLGTDLRAWADFEWCIIWRASQLKRKHMLLALMNLNPTIVGDDGWFHVLNGDRDCFEILSPINYYSQLPYFYNLCKINLNVTSAQMKTGVNQRIFDVPACQAFLLTDNQEQIEGLFEVGNEIICYETQEHLVDLASYYLRRPLERRQIARRGYKRVLQDHTYVHRIDTLIKKTLRE